MNEELEKLKELVRSATTKKQIDNALAKLAEYEKRLKEQEALAEIKSDAMQKIAEVENRDKARATNEMRIK